MQVKDFFKFWKISRLDAMVWMATFLTVVIVSIDVGLLVGIVLSLSCIFIRGMKPYICLLGHVPNTDLYLDVKRYKAVSVVLNKKTRMFFLMLDYSFSGGRNKLYQNFPLLRQLEFCIASIIQIGIMLHSWD